MTDVDRLRELLGNPSEDAISDNLLDYLLNKYEEDLNQAGAEACRVLARHFSHKADKTLGRIRKSYSNQAETWIKLAQDFEEQSAGLAKPLVGGITQSSRKSENLDENRTEPAFGFDLDGKRY